MNDETNWLRIDWQGLAAIATFFAVVVALIPIWREAKRVKSRARSLRCRLCAKLTQLKPSLRVIATGRNTQNKNVVFTKDKFADVVQTISEMMKETEVLQSDEQDQLGIVFANLEMAAVIYDNDLFEAESAKNILLLVERAITVMEKQGLLSGDVIKPWG